ncbi:MAG TPA: NAD-dependent epimerase/dehydratase family protein [candidate division WOR-3 bacterium]|uniref:NAD-dependent epimerase/dehydratase family protein n=1 Tax=candidate division WOR-3 bacterium TaxID=2052148 RepID=A0A7V0XFN3_UNCW3|nr:NAD-dependent epimerase/dehydratase family protein [candidate division WOR-3 bacterium]
MRWLVTGGAGFIGSHVVAGLLLRGEAVRVLDLRPTGNPACEFVPGDARDAAVAGRACAGVDVVLHHAPGLSAMLGAAVRAGVRRFVFASSCAVYGNPDRLPCDERRAPNPLSRYAADKLSDEFRCRRAAERDALETVVLRYFNVFGPRQIANGDYAAVVPGFVRALLAGRRPVLHGDGGQTRDFTPVALVVRANVAAGTAALAGRHLVSNVGTGKPTTLRELVALAGRLTGRVLEPVFAPERPGGIRHSVASTEVLREKLGVVPAEPFEGALAELVAWCRAEAGA